MITWMRVAWGWVRRGAENRIEAEGFGTGAFGDRPFGT